MSIADFLRKIGVLRSGTKTWSGDAKERPADDPRDAIEMKEMERKVDNATDNGSDSSRDSSSF